MSIDPRALRTYLAVCREGSISAAARYLNLSQPAVSTVIANLEAALNATLFARARSGIVLSPEGIVLKRRAEAVENLLRDTEEEVSLAREGLDGPLRIGGTPGALASLLPKIVGILEASELKYTMDLAEHPDAYLTHLLKSGEIDLAIVTTEIDQVQDELIEKTLLRDPFTLIAGRKNDHLPNELLLADAAGLPWVMPAAAGGFHRQIDALFIASQAPLPRNIIRCDSLLTTKAIVRTGRHVTILPSEVVAAELTSGDLRSIAMKDAHFDRSIGIRVLRQPYGRSALADRLVGHLQTMSQ